LFPNKIYLMAPYNAMTLWTGADQLYMSINGGTSWTAITATNTAGWYTPTPTFVNNFIVDKTPIDFIPAPASNPKANVLYVSARAGPLLVTSTLPAPPGLGATWIDHGPVPISAPQTTDLDYSAILIDPNDPSANTVYVAAANFGDVTGGGHIWMTTNGASG